MEIGTCGAGWAFVSSHPATVGTGSSLITATKRGAETHCGCSREPRRDGGHAHPHAVKRFQGTVLDDDSHKFQ